MVHIRKVGAPGVDKLPEIGSSSSQIFKSTRELFILPREGVQANKNAPVNEMTYLLKYAIRHIKGDISNSKAKNALQCIYTALAANLIRRK